jgi:hypothetical protein
VGKIWGLERDEEGNLPQVGQFAPSDPSVYTKLLDTYRQNFAADAGAAAALPRHRQRREPRLRRRHPVVRGPPGQARRAQAPGLRVHLGRGHADGPGGRWRVPDTAARIQVDWEDPATPTPGATTDALQKQVAAGIVPPTSDVVLRRAGYSPLERAQLVKDREDYAAEQALAAKAAQLGQEAPSDQPKPAGTPAKL